MGDGQNPLGGPAHHHQRGSRQPHGGQKRRHNACPHQNAHHRHSQKVGQQAIGRHLVKSCGRKRRCSQPRHARGDNHHRHRHQPSRQPLIAQKPLGRGVASDEGDCGRKRQLKARGQQAFRLPDQQNQRGQCHRTQGQNPTVQQDRAKQQRHHQKGAGGGHIGPRQHQIKQRRAKGQDRGCFFGVDPQSHGGNQCQAIADQRKDKAG